MRALILTCCSALLVAAPAAAQEPTTTTTTTPAAPTQQVKPRKTKMRITLERVNGKDRAVIAGSRLRVRGSVGLFVPGQYVVVRLYRGERKVAARRVAIQREGTSPSGTFVTGFAVSRSGTVTVRASHRKTAQLATLVAPRQRVKVLERAASYGSTGLVVRLLQRQLKARGYVVGQPGIYDGRTARAVAAFRKLTGMSRTEVASSDVFEKLARGAGYYKVRYPDHGHHVEADLTHQVLALIDGGKVERIYPISSGAPVTPTVLGSYKVYMKTPGTNQKGMVYSSFFIRGYAIHGYVSVPPYPASHGCLR
ncbi:MAG TPA: L,D-transpeptidase family protein, partial [Baekduia sp.]|nr:L,D-transpeptidase family protein [Baekduia sp.]